MTGIEVLDIEMGENDAGAKTVRDYLKRLLWKLWEEGECFGGKRPFGNSGWEYELYEALGKAGAIRCELDEWGNVEDCDTSAANQMIFSAITAI